MSLGTVAPGGRNLMGRVEVIVGCMYSGKTQELIRRLRRAQYAKQEIQSFKPDIDTRYSKDIHSHGDERFPSELVPCDSPEAILDLVRPGTKVVGVDEAQFFSGNLVQVVRALASRGHRVIVASLDMDFTGKPFGPSPLLLADAEEILKLDAVCVVCGDDATRTQRVSDNREQVVVGSTSVYEARCFAHWSPEPVFAGQENRMDLEG